MPERLVRQRRGLVDLYRITSSQRAEHAAVLLLRGSHFQSFRHDVPGVALDGRARRLREAAIRDAGQDGLDGVIATISSFTGPGPVAASA